MNDSTTHQDAPAAVFATTRWTLVLKARGDSPEARVALGELCAAYWHPVYQFICRNGRGADSAHDLTQGFFAQLLERGGVATVDRTRGRFRSFLLGAVKHYLADVHDQNNALKRGGGQTVVPLDEGVEESARSAPATPPPVDALFDREWAHTLVNRAVATLAAEHSDPVRRHSFEILKPWLLGDAAPGAQAEAARRLDWTENALRVAIHRLRRRFRELVRNEIGQTVDTPAEVADEMNYLIEVLCQ